MLVAGSSIAWLLLATLASQAQEQVTFILPRTPMVSSSDSVKPVPRLPDGRVDLSRLQRQVLVRSSGRPTPSGCTRSNDGPGRTSAPSSTSSPSTTRAPIHARYNSTSRLPTSDLISISWNSSVTRTINTASPAVLRRDKRVSRVDLKEGPTLRSAPTYRQIVRRLASALEIVPGLAIDLKERSHEGTACRFAGTAGPDHGSCRTAEGRIYSHGWHPPHFRRRRLETDSPSARWQDRSHRSLGGRWIECRYRARRRSETRGVAAAALGAHAARHEARAGRAVHDLPADERAADEPVSLEVRHELHFARTDAHLCAARARGFRRASGDLHGRPQASGRPRSDVVGAFNRLVRRRHAG